MQIARPGQGRYTPLAYLSPALLSIALLSLVPVLWTVFVAFTDLSVFTFRNYHLNGFANFSNLLTGPLMSLFFPLLGWNLVWAVSTVVLQVILGLALALMLGNSDLWEAPLYRSLLLIPWAMPGTITVLIWKGMLNESFGPINVLLRGLGLRGLPFLSDPLWARLAVIGVSVWFGFPYFMTLCSGAIQSISQELFEAVEIDGGGGWARLRHVTLPSIWSVIAPLAISSFAYNFNNFTGAFLITGGGPPRLSTQYAGYTDILISFGYKLTADFKQYGLASAMGIITFLLVAIFSLYQIRLIAREEVR